MYRVKYKLLKKTAYHCKSHLSANADFLHVDFDPNKKQMIELFSGSGHISDVFAQRGYNTFKVDIEEKYSPDLAIDILKLRVNSIPDSASVLWASVPCTHFTIANISRHWEKKNYAYRAYAYYPKTEDAKKSIQILEKTLWLIKNNNPDCYFIENPRGALRHLPQMKSIPFRYTVSYFDYGFGVYKPTDLFTNVPGLKFKELKGAMGRTFPETVQTQKDSFTRALVPPQLIHSIIDQL